MDFLKMTGVVELSLLNSRGLCVKAKYAACVYRESDGLHEKGSLG